MIPPALQKWTSEMLSSSNNNIELNNQSHNEQQDDLYVKPSSKPISSLEKGRKGLNKNYEFVATYPSLIEAKKAIEDRKLGNQLWTRGASYSTNIGDKINYTCRGFPKCPKHMQLLLDPESQDVHAHVSTDNHAHLSTSNRSGLDAVSKAKVLELIECGVTQPRKLLKELEKNGWYQGYTSAIPDHNNSNEADNRYIKEDQGRKRLGLIQFLCQLGLKKTYQQGIVRNISKL